MNDPDLEFPVMWGHPSQAELQWARESMHFPYALAPLATDYACDIIYGGINYRIEHFGLPRRQYCRAFNGYVYAADEWMVPPRERQNLIDRVSQIRLQEAPLVRAYWDGQVLPILLETYQWMCNAPLETAAFNELTSLWDNLWERMLHLWGLHHMISVASGQALNTLSDLYEACTPGAPLSEGLMLTQGLPNKLQGVQGDLYQLGLQARGRPSVAKLVVQRSEALTELSAVEGGTEFAEAVRAFLDAHGHLGQPFDDLSLPSWADEPSLVLAEVRKQLIEPPEDPEQRRLRLLADADALIAGARERLCKQPERQAQFESALTVARTAGPLSEDHNYWLDRMLHAHAHRFMLRMGQRLVEAGVLDGRGSIFFLHQAEIAAALRAPHDLRTLIHERQRTHEQQQSMRAPEKLGKAPAIPAVSGRFFGAEPGPTETGVLRGAGASKGIGRGPARVVLSASDFARVQRGDVLVCPSSNPTWVPLFGIVAAVVTNTCGILSHAAVVAREFGVPAVVGTGNATRLIHDGQVVEVDGAEGTVRIS